MGSAGESEVEDVCAAFGGVVIWACDICANGITQYYEVAFNETLLVSQIAPRRHNSSVEITSLWVLRVKSNGKLSLVGL